MTVRLLTVALRGDADVVLAHRRARDLASRLGFGVFEQARLGTAVSEIARHAVRHAGAGEACFEMGEGPPPSLEVVVRDAGPGLADPAGPAGRGLGIAGVQRLVDVFDLRTSEEGVVVRLGKRLPRTAKPVSAGTALRLAGELAAQVPASEEVRRLEALLLEREASLSTLARELDETNRGVIALCAELEERAEYQRRASALRARLLSDLGHELRTPLHSILTLSGFLLDRLDGDLSGEQERQVRILRHTAEGLADFVDDLLDVARADAGRLPVRVAPLSLAKLFGTLRAMLRPLVPAGVDLAFEDPGDVRLVTDEAKLAQILRNFVANALKFTERGHVRVRAAPARDGRLRVWVEDTGVGIAPEDQARVFEEFTQVEAAQRPRFKGSGLGLPLTRRLASLLGGEVGLESAPGAGSRFWVELPLELAGDAVSPRPPRAPGLALVPARAPTSGRCLRPGATVLVADDDEASRYLLRRALEDRFHVVEALTGASALRLAATEHPALAFLDLGLPDLPGGEVLARLAAEPATRAVPVALMTGRALTEAEREGVAGAVAVLGKPGVAGASFSAGVEAALAAAGLVSGGEP